MELRHLRYFLSVAELGSFSRASEKLFIAQPPLSITVRQLEEEVGAALLERHARGVKPTAAGLSLMRSAREILEQVERAKEQALRAQGGEGVVVTIGLVPSASHVVLPRLAREIARRHPTLVLNVQEMITTEQVQALQQDRIDFGIGRPLVVDRSVTSEATIDDPYFVAVPKGHALATSTAPLPVAQLAGEPLVAFSRYKSPAFFDQTLRVFTLAGFTPRIRFEATSIYTMLDFVSAGLGVAVVPRTTSLLPTTQVVYRPLPRGVRSGTLCLLRRKRKPTATDLMIGEIARSVFSAIDAELSTVGRPNKRTSAAHRRAAG